MVSFPPGLLNASFPCTQFPLPSTLTPHLMGKTPPWFDIITQSPMFNTGAVPGTSSTRENEMILRDGTILIHSLWPQQALQQSSPVLWCIFHSTGLKAPTNQTPSLWGDAFRSYWSGNSEGTTSISHHDTNTHSTLTLPCIALLPVQADLPLRFWLPLFPSPPCPYSRNFVFLICLYTLLSPPAYGSFPSFSPLPTEIRHQYSPKLLFPWTVETT